MITHPLSAAGKPSTSGARALHLLAAISLALGGCATTRTPNFSQTAASQQLVANGHDIDHRTPYVYTAPGTDWAQYTAVTMDPVTVYTGPDQAFKNISAEDRLLLSAFTQATFEASLKSRYRLVRQPDAKTLRIHITLAGASTNTPIVSTVSKLAPIGLVLNSVRSAQGKEGSFAGSISYEVEIYQSVTNCLLRAYVTKQYPGAENIKASVGRLDASKAGARLGAIALLNQIR